MVCTVGTTCKMTPRWTTNVHSAIRVTHTARTLNCCVTCKPSLWLQQLTMVVGVALQVCAGVSTTLPHYAQQLQHVKTKDVLYVQQASPS